MIDTLNYYLYYFFPYNLIPLLYIIEYIIYKKNEIFIESILIFILCIYFLFSYILPNKSYRFENNR